MREALGREVLLSPAGPVKPLSALTHRLPQPLQAPHSSAQHTVCARYSRRTRPVFLSNTFTCPLPPCGDPDLPQMHVLHTWGHAAFPGRSTWVFAKEGRRVFLATGVAFLDKGLMRIIGYMRGQQAGTADGCQDRYSQFCPLRPAHGPATTSRGTRALEPLHCHLVHRCLEAKNSFPL